MFHSEDNKLDDSVFQLNGNILQYGNIEFIKITKDGFNYLEDIDNMVGVSEVES